MNPACRLHSCHVVLALVASLGLSRDAAAQFDPSPAQLANILSRFPAADADEDGTLTKAEAMAFMRARRGGRDRAKRGPTGREITPDHADVSYGDHPNNKLDLWLAKSDAPTPLVVFIHGGGFVGGDKSSISSALIRQCLDAGASVASVNYRFRTEAAINVVLRDSARAIQFLRSKADEYHLDKTRVAALGGSAGAGTTLWLAFHDDLADPDNADPVLRESTRIVAGGSSAGQATYDILKWEDVLGGEEAMRFYPQDTWPAFYGLKTLDDLHTEEGKRLRADVDLLGLISADDPPVYLAAGEGHDALANKGDTNHTPLHSQAVKKRCDAFGVPAVLKIGGQAAGNTTQVDFLLEHLGLKPAAE